MAVMLHELGLLRCVVADHCRVLCGGVVAVVRDVGCVVNGLDLLGYVVMFVLIGVYFKGAKKGWWAA